MTSPSTLPVNQIIHGDAREVLRALPAQSVDMIITSPPYWALRDYGVEGQIGSEHQFGDYIAALVGVFAEAQRVLKDRGSCWVNLGDTYGTGSGAGLREGKQATNRGTQLNLGWQEKGKAGVPGLEKSLLQIPSRFAIEMTNRGWILRNEIIWRKPNCMPSSAKDRFTVDFEKLFFIVKKPRYYFRQQLEPLSPNSDVAYRARLRQGRAYHSKQPYRLNFPASFNNLHGRNRRCVWSIPTQPFSGAHFAVYPAALIETPIQAACPEGGVVLDPFLGSGTTALVALKHGRRFIGIDLNAEYVALATERISPFLGQERLAA
jgi:DNA modification methylase